MKKILISLFIVLTLAVSVGASYAIWLGDVEHDVEFSLSATDEYLFISSDSLVITSDNKTFSPGNKLTYGFDLKVTGINANITFSSIDIMYNGGANGTFVTLTPGIVNITLPDNLPNVVAGVSGVVIPCTMSIEFILSADALDRHYANKQFKFKLVVAAAPSMV